MDTKNTQDRLKALIAHSGMNIKEFCDLTAIPYKTMQNYLAGTRKIGAEALTAISLYLKADIDWLLTGEGGMYRDARPQPDTRLSALAALMDGLTESQQQDVVREIEEKQRINRLAEAVEELKQQVAQGQSSSEKTGTA